MKKAILCAALALAGCGGGGDSAVTPAVTTFPVEAVLTTVATTAGTYGGNYADSTGSYALAISIAPGAAANFGTSPNLSKTYTTSTVLRKNGGIVGTATAVTYFSTGPLALIGIQAGSDVTIPSQRTTLPASATVGTSGPFYTGTQYLGGSTVLTSAATGSWSLEQDTASTAFLCLNTSIAGTLRTTEADCFKINATGAIVGFKAITTTNARSTNLNPVVDTFTFQ
jgi:hypothetical protein